MAVYQSLSLELDAVMTAHVAFEAFDGHTATFEPRLIRDILRGEFGFAGLVFSDDLSMKGAGGESPLERARRALSSGCDAILYCNHPDEVDEVLGSLEWRREERFSARFSRLLPRGEAASDLAALRASETYRSARRTLERAGFEAAFEGI